MALLDRHGSMPKKVPTTTAPRRAAAFAAARYAKPRTPVDQAAFARQAAEIIARATTPLTSRRAPPVIKERGAVDEVGHIDCSEGSQHQVWVLGYFTAPGPVSCSCWQIRRAVDGAAELLELLQVRIERRDFDHTQREVLTPVQPGAK
jgi:hypothetical protein